MIRRDPTAARRYASALFTLEKKRGRAKKALEELSAAEKLFESDRDLRKIFATTAISRAEKEGLIEKLLGSGSPEVRNFIKLLVRKNRFPLLGNVRGFFQELYDADEGIEEVRLVSALPLDRETEEKIRKAVEKKLNRKVLLASAIDPSVIGGIALYTRTSVLDGTLSYKIHQLRQCLEPQRGNHA